MRKIFVLALVIFLIIMCSACMQYLSDDEKDSRIWDNIVKDEISRQKIKRIEIQAFFKSKTIPPDKHRFVIDELKRAKFYKSNRQGFGPTPESSIVIFFNNKTELRLNYWEGGIFEHSRTANGETSQFLILNERLGDWHKTFIDWPPPIPRGDWPETTIYYYGTDYHPASAMAAIDAEDLNRIGDVRINNQIVPVFVRKSDSGVPKSLYVHFSDFDMDSYKVYMR